MIAILLAASLSAGQCKAVSDHPDPRCTPGRVNPSCTVADICPHLDGKQARNVSAATKRAVAKAYGHPNWKCPGEIDHLVSLELCGMNTLDNLWCEPGNIPNLKDRTAEDPLHVAVCAGRISLEEAQRILRTDWTQAQKALGAK